jgi:hypothetical protein
MGDNRIIWVPSALHEMIKDFEKSDVMVSIKYQKNELIIYFRFIDNSIPIFQ